MTEQIAMQPDIDDRRDDDSDGLAYPDSPTDDAS